MLIERRTIQILLLGHNIFIQEWYFHPLWTTFYGERIINA